jgi:hypothetical protein
MKKPFVWVIWLALIAVGAYLGYRVCWNAFYFTVERTDVSPSPDPLDDLKLVDDRLEDKNPAFDPQMVDRRDYEGWQINNSAAVIRLDCPDIRPDRESAMTRLYASYADAIREAESGRRNLLPSANMLDGIAKQFDDGLYAALDLACFQGDAGFSPSAVDFVEDVFTALPPRSDARAFLAAALQLADRPVPLEPVPLEQVPLEQGQQAAADTWFAKFEADLSRSKPISFYTWNDDLRRVWKFFRFLQHRFDQADLAVPLDIAEHLASDETLRIKYEQLIGFYSGLTNPPDSLNLSQLTGADSDLGELARQHGVQRSVVSVLPPSTSRDTELFSRLFADGRAAQANLMVELIRRIRSGTVDLTPRAGSGWYDHQVYALETLVLPERGAENRKLLLTAKYKRRLIQAFQALITKRRETHARQLAATDAAMAMPPRKVRPRLRVEPCATFYFRTARSYAFLESFLQANIDDGVLSQLHGLRKEGERELDLQSELAAMKELFYGFYLVACEDIAVAHELTDDESVDSDAAYALAEKWLGNLNHRDLAVDTRVSVPVLNDPIANSTRLWATIGVRLVKLDAEYARAPKMRQNAQSQWQDVEDHRLGEANYVIAVDEFAEFSLPGRQALTRQELRDLCDRHKTKSAIVQALSN